MASTLLSLTASAWLWELIGLVCAAYFNRSGVFQSVEQNLKSALTIFSFTANIGHMYGWLAPNNVYWSLSLEEQFYVLLPLFLLLVTGRRARILALLLVIAVQFPLARSAYGDLASQYLASFRIDGFAWGILIFMFSRSTWFRRLEPRVLTHRPLACPCRALLAGHCAGATVLLVDQYGLAGDDRRRASLACFLRGRLSIRL